MTPFRTLVSAAGSVFWVAASCAAAVACVAVAPGAARAPPGVLGDRPRRYCWCVATGVDDELSDGYLAGGPAVTDADVLARAALDLVTSPALHPMPPGWVDPADRRDDADD